MSERAESPEWKPSPILVPDLNTNPASSSSAGYPLPPRYAAPVQRRMHGDTAHLPGSRKFARRWEVPAPPPLAECVNTSPHEYAYCSGCACINAPSLITPIPSLQLIDALGAFLVSIASISVSFPPPLPQQLIDALGAILVSIASISVSFPPSPPSTADRCTGRDPGLHHCDPHLRRDHPAVHLRAPRPRDRRLPRMARPHSDVDLLTDCVSPWGTGGGRGLA